MEELATLPVEEGGLLSDADLEPASSKELIRLLHENMIRKCPPGTDIPPQDTLRVWRAAKHRTPPVKYYPAIAAYRGKGETPAMIRNWLIGKTSGDEPIEEIQPITAEQVYASDYEQTVWLLLIATSHLKSLSDRTQQEKAVEVEKPRSSVKITQKMKKGD
jgi:hypothetical protein